MGVTMADLMKDIRAFHEKFELTYDGKPRVLKPELAVFRIDFMIEEVEEYSRAITAAHSELHEPGLLKDKDRAFIAEQLEKQLDALVDLVYVALGTAYLHGFDFNEAWRRVHEANMKKVRARNAGESKRGSIYDVVKPAGWEPPSHIDLVEENIHND